MSPIIPGSIVANIHTRPGLVPSGRLLQSLRQADLLRRRFPHVRFPEAPSDQAPPRRRNAGKSRQLDEAQLAGWVKQANQLPGGDNSDRKCPACVKLLSCVGNSVYSEPKLLSCHLGGTNPPPINHEKRRRGGAVKIFHKKKVIVCPQKTKSETHQRSSTLH